MKTVSQNYRFIMKRWDIARDREIYQFTKRTPSPAIQISSSNSPLQHHITWRYIKEVRWKSDLHLFAAQQASVSNIIIENDFASRGPGWEWIFSRESSHHPKIGAGEVAGKGGRGGMRQNGEKGKHFPLLWLSRSILWWSHCPLLVWTP